MIKYTINDSAINQAIVQYGLNAMTKDELTMLVKLYANDDNFSSCAISAAAERMLIKQEWLGL